jgi:threonine dehydrogenase-like Zn-dependent dehydrogenase
VAHWAGGVPAGLSQAPQAYEMFPKKQDDAVKIVFKP